MWGSLIVLMLSGADAVPPPPVAKRKDHVTTLHGETLTDPYFWLREKKNDEVIAYLDAENAYTKARTKHLEAFQGKLYKEGLSRFEQTDLSVPTPDGGYLYYSRTVKGQQYPIYCRKKGDKGAEEVLLDGNELAKGKKFFSIGRQTVSPDGKKLAYAVDETGFRNYHLAVKDLTTGKLIEESRRKTSNFVWAADSRTLLYVTEDAAKRAHKLWRHVAGSGTDVLVYEEKDELFRLSVNRSRDRQYVFATSRSSTTTEVRMQRADLDWDAWLVIRPREEGHEYTVEVRHDVLWIRSNKDAKGFRVMTALVTDTKVHEWKEAAPHREGVTIQSVIPFGRFLVYLVRENGLPQVEVHDTERGETHRIEWPEPVYSAFATPTPEFDTPKLRLSYTSLLTPRSVIEYDMVTRKGTVLKQEKVLGEYDPAQYRSERIFATAKDGTKIPISLVYRPDTKLDGTAPLWLSGYGSYGASIPPAFSVWNLPLLERGVVLAQAHIRGGGDMGKVWHDDGKMMKKKNTFTDFIACADHLIANKYGSRDRLAIEGASAGGLLIGAVLNERPDLCKAAVLGVPFVDVINTMLDETLPLTVQEFLEWGNPKKKAEYDYLKSYCPYTNLKSAVYPAMLVTTSLNDSQVMYWEPAKYVAKSRTLRKGDAPLLFKCNMAGGHGGSSGRYDALKERAFKMAFVLDQLGVKE